MSTVGHTMALFGDVTGDPALPSDQNVTVIPWTAERGIAVFLNRWCHRALGDRDDAERELRELIERSKVSR
jgi:hypothetical protein